MQHVLERVPKPERDQAWNSFKDERVTELILEAMRAEHLTEQAQLLEIQRVVEKVLPRVRQESDGFDIKVVQALNGEELCTVTAQSHWQAQHLKRGIHDATKINMSHQRFVVDTTPLPSDKLLKELRTPGEPLIVQLLRQGNTDGGWMRLESKTRRGVFFYFHTVTGESRAEPPPPWEKRESRTAAGVFFYWNPMTGETSAVKPDIISPPDCK